MTDTQPVELTYSATKTGDRSILPADMISVEEARTRILEAISPLPPVEVELGGADGAALGLVLAEDVVATFDIPPLANVSMDGYAVRSVDTQSASYDSPVTLDVIGYLAAGSLFEGSVGPGQAVRIMTGAVLPAGADAVVPFEETDEYDWTKRESARAPGSWESEPRDTVRVDVRALPGANIREAGEDVRSGTTVLPAGTVLGPAEIGVLASLGRATAKVHRRPVVAILSTGDELLRPGQPLTPGKIYDSNTFSLAAQVRQFGGIPRVLDIATDTVEALTARIAEGIADADMLVTSAGVSRGDFDVVKQVLAAEGEVGFWTVRMKPGKPLAFGSIRRPHGSANEAGHPEAIPQLGLPGNPVSAMVTFELFGRAAIFKMLGLLRNNPDAWRRPVIRAVAMDRIKNTDGRRFYSRCRLTREGDRWVARLTGAQGSGVLTSMALADGFAICPEDVDAIEPGEECEVMVLRDAVSWWG